MDIHIVANWLTGFCEAYFLYVLFETFLERREYISKAKYIVCFVLLAILIDVSNSLFDTSIINISLVLLFEILISFLYEGSIKIRIISSIINSMLIIMTEVIVLLFLSAIFDQNVNNVISKGIPRLMGIGLSKILCYSIVKYINHRFNHNKITIGVSYWILFVIMFSITTITMYTFCEMLEEGASNHIRNLSILCSCGFGAVTIIILYLYDSTFKQKYLITKKQLKEVQLKEQVKHYNDIMMTQGQVKKIKHDLENHLLAIQSYIEKSQYEQCGEYIASLLKETDKGTVYVNTGNIVLDAIISAKKAEAEMNGIEFNIKVKIPSELPIEHEDECIIFGNALDNAIEACKKCIEKKCIDISLIFNKDTLMCKISNPCTDSKGDCRITTKTDKENHGIGKENIKNALAKYSSVSRVTCEDNVYTLFIIIMGLSK